MKGVCVITTLLGSCLLLHSTFLHQFQFQSIIMYIVAGVTLYVTVYYTHLTNCNELNLSGEDDNCSATQKLPASYRTKRFITML